MRPASRRPARRPRGFTIVEVMIALLIVGVLLALAYPSYQNAVRKGRRADAFAALTAVQQAQERYRANRSAYAGNLSTPADADTLPNVAATSANGHYVLALSGPSATGYTATATAVGGQAADGDCALLGVRADAGRLWYGSGRSSIDWSTPSAADRGKCWAK